MLWLTKTSSIPDEPSAFDTRQIRCTCDNPVFHTTIYIYINIVYVYIYTYVYIMEFHANWINKYNISKTVNKT